jgi:hypothetical protein
MPIVLLYEGPEHQQDEENSCWASVIRLVNNVRAGEAGGTQYDTDQEVADRVNLNTDQEQNVLEVLAALGMGDGTDSEFIPAWADIMTEIDNGRIIILNVSPTRHGYLCRQEITGGHYVAVVGYNSDTSEIAILDPATGQVTWGPYHQTEYGERFWCGTAYTNGQPIQ